MRKVKQPQMSSNVREVATSRTYFFIERSCK
nr:MAG TPA: hypothetical protein [Caudoviricetes sp.]